MKNLAIIISVSDYQNALDLPACKKDIEIMEQLLCATPKYDILCINDPIGKGEVIQRIENFLPKNDDSTDIGEILFYFTGHGYQDTEAHFVLYNTSLEKINTTSLNNNEVDAIARRYNPKLYVKIIDACQSGLSYIKSASMDDKLEICPRWDKPEKGLENGIFMCSSKSNQSSMATNEYSLFTKSFVDAVVNAPSESPIRFTDIQNYITDYFNSINNEQTPYFVMQADGRDVFTSQNPEIKSLINSLNQLADIKADNETHSNGNDKVEEFLRQYRPKEAVKAILDEIIETSTSFFFQTLG